MLVRTLAPFVVVSSISAAHAEPQPPRDPDRVAVAEALSLVGGASLLTGVVLGFKARADYQSAFDSGHCMNPSAEHPVCDATGYSQAQSAHTLGNAGTLLGIGGLALVGAGAITYFTAPRIGATVTPVVDEHGAAVVLGGRF